MNTPQKVPAIGSTMAKFLVVLLRSLCSWTV